MFSCSYQYIMQCILLQIWECDRLSSAVTVCLSPVKIKMDNIVYKSLFLPFIHLMNERNILWCYHSQLYPSNYRVIYLDCNNKCSERACYLLATSRSPSGELFLICSRPFVQATAVARDLAPQYETDRHECFIRHFSLHRFFVPGLAREKYFI